MLTAQAMTRVSRRAIDALSLNTCLFLFSDSNLESFWISSHGRMPVHRRIGEHASGFES